MEDPKKAKRSGQAREIIRRVTPGTVVEASMLDEAAIISLPVSMPPMRTWACAFADISTGVVYATDTEEWVDVYNELARFSPREIHRRRLRDFV